MCVCVRRFLISAVCDVTAVSRSLSPPLSSSVAFLTLCVSVLLDILINFFNSSVAPTLHFPGLPEEGGTRGRSLQSGLTWPGPGARYRRSPSASFCPP